MKEKLGRKEYFDLVDKLNYEILSKKNASNDLLKIFAESKDLGVKVYLLKSFMVYMRDSNFNRYTKGCSAELRKCIANSVVKYLADNLALVGDYTSKLYPASRGIELPKDKPEIDEYSLDKLFDVPDHKINESNLDKLFDNKIEISTGYRVNRDFFAEEPTEYLKSKLNLRKNLISTALEDGALVKSRIRGNCGMLPQ